MLARIMMIALFVFIGHFSNAVLNIDGTQTANYLLSMTSAEKPAAQDKLTLNFDGNTNSAEMTIYSMQGQEVIRMNVESGHSYNVSELTNGFYNVSISIDGVKQYRTLVITK